MQIVRLVVGPLLLIRADVTGRAQTAAPSAPHPTIRGGVDSDWHRLQHRFLPRRGVLPRAIPRAVLPLAKLNPVCLCVVRGGRRNAQRRRPIREGRRGSTPTSIQSTPGRMALASGIAERPAAAGAPGGALQAEGTSRAKRSRSTRCAWRWWPQAAGLHQRQLQAPRPEYRGANRARAEAVLPERVAVRNGRSPCRLTADADEFAPFIAPASGWTRRSSTGPASRVSSTFSCSSLRTQTTPGSCALAHRPPTRKSPQAFRCSPQYRSSSGLKLEPARGRRIPGDRFVERPSDELMRQAGGGGLPAESA